MSETMTYHREATYPTPDGNVLVIWHDDNTQRMSLQTRNGVVLGEASFSGNMTVAAVAALGVLIETGRA